MFREVRCWIVIGTCSVYGLKPFRHNSWRSQARALGQIRVLLYLANMPKTLGGGKMLFGVLKIETMSFPFKMPVMSKDFMMINEARRRRRRSDYLSARYNRDETGRASNKSKQQTLPNPRIARFFQGKRSRGRETVQDIQWHRCTRRRNPFSAIQTPSGTRMCCPRDVRS